MLRSHVLVTILVTIGLFVAPVAGVTLAGTADAGPAPDGSWLSATAGDAAHGSPAAANTTTNATFTVSDLNAPANVTQGATIEVNATVTNTGNGSGTQTVEYRFNDTVRESTSVQPDANNSTVVSFSFETAGVAAGNYTHGVFTDDDNATAEIEVLTNESDDGNETDTGPEQGPPPQDLAAWKSTSPLTGKQTTPGSLAGKIRVESQFKSNTSVELKKNTSTNYTIAITVTGNATNVTFFLQEEAVTASQNISDVVLYIDGNQSSFYVNESAGPGNSPWILFEVGHFSTRTASFESSSTTINEAIAGSDGQISLAEIQDAITTWASGGTVDGTGETISLSKIQELVQLWASGGSV